MILKKRTISLYLILVALLLLLFWINISSGSVKLSFNQLMKILIFRNREDINYTVIWNIRLPRLIAATFLGGSLALSGYLLQKFFSNPIAGPFVLGISSGAKFCVGLLMVLSYKFAFRMNSLNVITAAFIGSALVAFIVILVSGAVKNNAVLIVCGVMVGYICSAATELMVAFADDSNIVNLHNWSMGSFSGISWNNVAFIVPLVVCVTLVTFLLSKGIEAYSYGEEYAFSLGISIKSFRLVLILLSSILSATVTAFAGPIAFVGIAVPHLIVSIFKTTKPQIVITASFFGGAVFCLFCDLLARYMFAPMELSISTITSIFGAPVVISILLKRHKNRK